MIKSRVVELSDKDAEATYKDTSGLIYKTINEMLEKFAPKYLKGFETGKDGVIVNYFSSLSIEKKTIYCSTIGGLRGVAGYVVIHTDHDGYTKVVKETVSWSEACYKFVMQILKNEVRQHLEIVTAIPEDCYE